MTPSSVELIRSISNIRGDDLDAVERATRIGLDALYIDLEEPRTPFSEQDRARVRSEAGDWLRTRQVDAGTRLFARVQSIWSGQMLADTEAIVGPALAGVVLPKVDGPRDVLAADALMTGLESEHRLTPGSLLIYPILETAEALRQAYAIAMASPRVAYMGGAVSRFGDIVQALGYRWTPGGRESYMFRSSALMDCRAAGMPYPITGASSHDVDDVAGVRRWAEEGRALGYRGSQVRALASHVAIVNEVFAPHIDERVGPSLRSTRPKTT
jgi:citrate lyase subunit beta / citryl-CoA lyase